MADIAQLIDAQTEDVPLTIKDLLADIEQLRELNESLLAAAVALSIAWADKPPLAWQPDGHMLLLTNLRVAIAKAYGNE
jgi:hypothetical protein